jgi:hypothetical protein
VRCLTLTLKLALLPVAHFAGQQAAAPGDSEAPYTLHFP